MDDVILWDIAHPCAISVQVLVQILSIDQHLAMRGRDETIHRL